MNKRQKKKKAALAAKEPAETAPKEKIGLPKVTPKIHTPPRIRLPIRRPGPPKKGE